MIDIIIFTIQCVLQFINSLRSIIIPGTNLTLLGFYVGILLVSIIVSFIRHFFMIEKSLLNTKIDGMYFKRRNELINSVSENKLNRKHSTKYLQNNFKRLK